MCPDSQILSIYLDGELPSPWKEKMESHLAACPACKEKLADYKRVQNIFKNVRNTPEEIVQKRTFVDNDGTVPVIAENNTEELLAKSQERVWSRLASIKRYNPTTGLVRQRGNIRGYSIWRRKISIPLPAVAAAILIIIGAVVFLQNRNTQNNYNNQITEYPNFEYPNFIEEMPAGFIPTAQDMNSVLQYLDASGADVIILQIPESKNFSRSGEPAIIRAADYSEIDRSGRRRRQ